MLVNTRKSTTPVGFNPNVDNEPVLASSVVTKGNKALWVVIWFFCIITVIGWIPLLVCTYRWGNWFNQQQVAVNQAASSIDVNLAKRRDTLIKLLEQAKAYMKFESSTFADVTKLRSMRNLSDISQANEAQAIMDKIANQFNINVENYPMLKANSIVQELMSASQYAESELAASRRLYNLKATEFNQQMVTFPRLMKAAKMGLSTFAMFAASEIQRQDVDMSALGGYAG